MNSNPNITENILITGALGQLGMALISEFQHDAQRFVLATDIAKPSSDLPVPFEPADVCDINRLHTLVETYNIDCIYHFAALLSAKGEQYPIKTWDINMLGFRHIISIAQQRKSMKIFWPSSIAVFGPQTPQNHTPQNAYANPHTMYGITKRAGEHLMEYYRVMHGLDIRSLRFPGIISLDTSPGGGTTDYIIELLQAAQKHHSYRCFLKADTALPMLHIQDAVHAMRLLMHASNSRLKTQTAYNITGFSITPAQVVAALQARKINISVTYEPDFRQDIAASWPASVDDSAARNEWGWKPEYDLSRCIAEAFQQSNG